MEKSDMEKPTNSLFEVFLRLRPPVADATERFLDVEADPENDFPIHITVKPPANDHRKRAVERFAFTRVFEEDATQLELFNETGVLPLVEGVLGAEGREGRDGLLATLGVTGSGKSHTILGTKSQRGLTQMALDVLFHSIADNLVHPTNLVSVFPSIAGSDVSEGQLFPATVFLDSLYGDGTSVRGSCSRAQTPMPVNSPFLSPTYSPSKMIPGLYPSLEVHLNAILSPPKDVVKQAPQFHNMSRPSNNVNSHTPRSQSTSVFQRFTRSQAKLSSHKDASFLSLPSTKHRIPRPSALPQLPNLDDIRLDVDSSAEYSVVVSMFEVYNDRIFDLLAGTSTSSGVKPSAAKRRALLFKSTEMSPDRKVVAGLRKIVCCNLEEALTVLETGLIERRVAGTGSNAVSSRSHGFFCFEVKKRNRVHKGPWSTSTLTIVDLAGSERARQAKTAGATLAEAGKINESLMYLGQCMQMQSDNQEGNKQSIVPFRQCKLTELLFSNSFPSPSITAHHQHFHYSHRNPQKAIMVVTANPTGDFNATSQILRYSALAREVTVPRIPSVTSQVFGPGGFQTTNSGRNTPLSAQEDFELVLNEISRLSEERDVLSLELEEERSRREAAEASWAATEIRMQEIEQEVRDECYTDFEARLEQERRRWKGAWEEEADRNDEHLDKKIDILAKGIDSFEILEDRSPTRDERVRELEDENDALRRKLEMLEREMLQRSPVKKQRVLKARKWQGEENEVLASP